MYFYRICYSSNRFLTAKTAPFSRTVHVFLSIISRSQVETVVQIFAHVEVERCATIKVGKTELFSTMPIGLQARRVRGAHPPPPSCEIFRAKHSTFGQKHKIKNFDSKTFENQDKVCNSRFNWHSSRVDYLSYLLICVWSWDNMWIRKITEVFNLVRNIDNYNLMEIAVLVIYVRNYRWYLWRIRNSTLFHETFMLRRNLRHRAGWFISQKLILTAIAEVV